MSAGSCSATCSGLMERIGSGSRRLRCGTRWMAHPDVRVRLQAIRLQLSRPDDREAALRTALEDADRRFARPAAWRCRPAMAPRWCASPLRWPKATRTTNCGRWRCGCSDARRNSLRFTGSWIWSMADAPGRAGASCRRIARAPAGAGGTGGRLAAEPRAASVLAAAARSADPEIAAGRAEARP